MVEVLVHREGRRYDTWLDAHIDLKGQRGRRGKAPSYGEQVRTWQTHPVLSGWSRTS